MNPQSIIPPNIDYGKISAEPFSDKKPYVVGELCIQFNKLWKFKSPKESGVWDESKVEETTIAKELKFSEVKFTETTLQLSNIIQGSSGYVTWNLPSGIDVSKVISIRYNTPQIAATGGLQLTTIAVGELSYTNYYAPKAISSLSVSVVIAHL